MILAEIAHIARWIPGMGDRFPVITMGERLPETTIRESAIILENLHFWTKTHSTVIRNSIKKPDGRYHINENKLMIHKSE